MIFDLLAVGAGGHVFHLTSEIGFALCNKFRTTAPLLCVERWYLLHRVNATIDIPISGVPSIWMLPGVP